MAQRQKMVPMTPKITPFPPCSFVIRMFSPPLFSSPLYVIHSLYYIIFIFVFYLLIYLLLFCLVLLGFTKLIKHAFICVCAVRPSHTEISRPF